VKTYEVRTKADLIVTMGEESALDIPASAALVVVRMDEVQQLHFVPVMVSAKIAADLQSGRRQVVTTTKDCVDRLNDPEVQAKMMNNEDKTQDVCSRLMW
jgi:hypothetical protein